MFGWQTYHLVGVLRMLRSLCRQIRPGHSIIQRKLYNGTGKKFQLSYRYLFSNSGKEATIL